ncbi:hypothetical protein F5148DRAFT_1371243 [Russula earlei]|uniref:Uncharacterized protein n=1 Tax=Russula earlei TaxID=71964 RepID=A0ACC0TTQ7_9AGAM|nr:hypothetical protein F5148DRAFT_1371243 [Russula earlei]
MGKEEWEWEGQEEERKERKDGKTKNEDVKTRDFLISAGSSYNHLWIVSKLHLQLLYQNIYTDSLMLLSIESFAGSRVVLNLHATSFEVPTHAIGTRGDGTLPSQIVFTTAAPRPRTPSVLWDWGGPQQCSHDGGPSSTATGTISESYEMTSTANVAGTGHRKHSGKMGSSTVNLCPNTSSDTCVEVEKAPHGIGRIAHGQGEMWVQIHAWHHADSQPFLGLVTPAQVLGDTKSPWMDTAYASGDNKSDQYGLDGIPYMVWYG